MKRIKERISPEEYLLENSAVIHFDPSAECWKDQQEHECEAVIIGGELAGFSFKRLIDDVDRQIYAMTEEGLTYLEYNRRIGGEPFGFTIGMPIEADPDKYGGIAEMYRECIRLGITWEELLQWSGHSDELPMS